MYNRCTIYTPCTLLYLLCIVGAKSLKEAGATRIEVEDFGDSEGFLFQLVYMFNNIMYVGAAEGSILALYHYDHYKSEKSSYSKVTPHTRYATCMYVRNIRIDLCNNDWINQNLLYKK